MLIYGVGEPFDDLFVFAEEHTAAGKHVSSAADADATAFTLALPLLRSEALYCPGFISSSETETSTPSIVSG